MPAKIDEKWWPVVKGLKANNPSWGAVRIAKELQGEEPVSPISPRTVTTMLQRIKTEDLSEYRYYYWPESMEDHSLPWEASPAALELLQTFLEMGFISPGRLSPRPTIRLVRWFWRVTLAADSAPFDWRLKLARVLAAVEVLEGQQAAARHAEGMLAFRAWRPEMASLYEAYREAGGFPEGLIIPPSLDSKAVDAIVEWGFHHDAARAHVEEQRRKQRKEAENGEEAE